MNNPLPTFDLRALDLAGFRHWLDLHLARWASDPAFVQRARVRDLRRAHPDVRRLEEDHRRAVADDAASALGPRLLEIERQLYDAGKAVAGLAEAILRANPTRRPSMEAKRDAFVNRQRALDEERAALTHASPERRELLRATATLEQFRADIGLDREEAALNELLMKRGRGAGRAGTAFEEEALNVTRERIAPPEAHLLQTVRLGAAGVELDIVVVRQPGGSDAPVEVLAAIEAKRNVNDLGHGFLRRQIDLAWLTGDRAAYDPAEHRTGTFDAGHFDRPAAHWQGGRAYLFAPGSFSRFARDGSGYFRDGLWLVTRAGPVWGLSGAALARLAAAVSTDEDWDPDDETKLARLFAWARSLAGPVETPDVVKLYSEPPWAGQIIVMENAFHYSKAAT